MSRLRVTTGLQHFLTPSDHFHDLPYSAQILSFCPTTILPEILSAILILPDNSTLHNRQAAACNTSHDFNLLKTSGHEFDLFLFSRRVLILDRGREGFKAGGQKDIIPKSLFRFAAEIRSIFKSDLCLHL